VECNLQRFYFPECKAYELDHQNVDPECRKKFWNAVESFGRYYPLPLYVILGENEDAYQGRDCAPLISTPGQPPYVYVNRFGTGGKMLYHVYNATGHTFDGPALSLRLEIGEHVFDLLRCRDMEWIDDGTASPAELRVYLPREDVACLARLQRLLKVRRSGDTLDVEVRLPTSDCQLAVAGVTGERLQVQAAKPGRNQLELGRFRDKAGPCCVKLLRNGLLLDAAAIPDPSADSWRP
jgi:hypothetical protein